LPTPRAARCTCSMPSGTCLYIAQLRGKSAHKRCKFFSHTECLDRMCAPGWYWGRHRQSGILTSCMPLTELQVAGYRSVRDLTIALGPVNIITGANGSGKSNLYQCLVLLAKAAQGGFAKAVALEGGTPSLLWAGGERIRYTKKKPAKRVHLAVQTDEFSFSFACGIPSPSSLPVLPPPRRTLFALDPEVKEEKLSLISGSRPVLMLDRQGPTVWIRNAEAKMDEYAFALSKHESVLSQILEPHRYPEVSAVRQQILTWRFYHQFRTDADSPLRFPQVGVHTDVLASDGSDLAAALQTITEIGDEGFLTEAISNAFRGASLCIAEHDTLFSLSLQMPGLLRTLSARELSDGQLRFLCLCAALLSPRPPALIALNEPETSLHPDLYGPLAELIRRAAAHSQIWVTTHSQVLAGEIANRCRVTPLELRLVEGETRLSGDRNTPRRPHRIHRFDDAGEDR
jgi:predicted ATPase